MRNQVALVSGLSCSLSFVGTSFQDLWVAKDWNRERRTLSPTLRLSNFGRVLEKE
jgi:hypothetical protein